MKCHDTLLRPIMRSPVTCWKICMAHSKTMSELLYLHICTDMLALLRARPCSIMRRISQCLCGRDKNRPLTSCVTSMEPSAHSGHMSMIVTMALPLIPVTRARLAACKTGDTTDTAYTHEFTLQLLVLLATFRVLTHCVQGPCFHASSAALG